MNEVGRELDRLRRGWRTTRGRALANRAHLALLAAAVALALGHRLLGPFAPFEALARDGLVVYGLRAAAIALGLLLLRPLLRFAVPPLFRVSRPRLAADLDDRMGWGDAIGTALALPPAEERTPVATFLLAQSAGRLRSVDPRRLWWRGREWRWSRRILAALFVALLLLPGVLGMPERGGAGRGETGIAGTRPETVTSEPLPVDVWLLTHVHDPLPAEPLEPDPPAGEDRR